MGPVVVSVAADDDLDRGAGGELGDATSRWTIRTLAWRFPGDCGLSAA